MTPRKNHILRWTLVVLISSGLFIFLVGSIFSHYASQKVEGRLKSFGGKIGSININLFLQRITINDFELNLPGDTVNKIPHTAKIKNIVLKNINLFQFLANKNLRINEILMADGNIRFNKKITIMDSVFSSKGIALKGIFIDHLIFKNLNVVVVNDSLMDYTGIINMSFVNIQSSDAADLSNLKAYNLKNIEGKITKLLIHHPHGYQTKISTVYANSNTQNLRFDSIFLIPKYPKYKFARVAGKQIDRINAFIRSVQISGLQFDQFRDSALIANKMDIISGEVFSFRDRRMPFREKENKPLPMAALGRLDLAVEIDTILIKDSKITYEEFPPNGFKSGKLVFENLNATLINATNRIHNNKPKHATLNASAKLMGKGLIQASFILPMDGDKPYHTEGKISKMLLYHLNPILENLAFISIESGTLNELYFNFDYNDRISNGKLIINYEDLKIKGLKKEKSAGINDIKSFLINTVVKNDKDKSVPAEKRTGTITFERDRKRQVFNYWWKSLWSGIKGSVLNNKGRQKA